MPKKGTNVTDVADDAALRLQINASLRDFFRRRYPRFTDVKVARDTGLHPEVIKKILAEESRVGSGLTFFKLWRAYGNGFLACLDPENQRARRADIRADLEAIIAQLDDIETD